MVIFFFSLCLLLLLLLLLRLLLLFLLLLLHLSCPAQHQGCLLQRLVLTGTDVNIHPIPHFQKSFPLKPTPSPFPPAQHFACQSPPSSLLRSLFPLHKTTPFHGQPLQIPPFIHENAPFHGQPHQFRPFVHEKPIFHGQPLRNPSFIHENAPFHGQPHQFPPLIHEKPCFHGQPLRIPPFIHENAPFHGQPLRIPSSGAGCLGEAMSIAGPRMFQSPGGLLLILLYRRMVPKKVG